jgi:peptide/nickel transport system ATP-binding protein
MDLRVRIADREVGVEYAWEQVEERNPGSDREDLREEFIDELRDHELDTEPDGVHRQRVDEAIEYLADEEFEAAGDLLREHYESVCETQEPTLGDGANPKSCHLFDADEVGEIPGTEDGAHDGAVGADD